MSKASEEAFFSQNLVHKTHSANAYVHAKMSEFAARMNASRAPATKKVHFIDSPGT
jgi:hypothetical protein